MRPFVKIRYLIEIKSQHQKNQATKKSAKTTNMITLNPRNFGAYCMTSHNTNNTRNAPDEILFLVPRGEDIEIGVK